jgi:ATP-dependent DNA helicase PIF1
MNTLNEEQLEIFNSYKEGSNIFLTGPGGCGKSYLIKTIVNDAKNNNIDIAVTALTGCAAVLLNCGAKTLHSWAGIGLAKNSDDSIITKISLNKYKKKNWIKTKILIIDEVSMMSKRLFDLLDAIGKRIRKNAKPFGGIQIIFSGDFYQLPPVGNKDDPDSSKFCFESELWDETFDYQYILDKSFRQKDDTFINILKEIRQGKIFKNSLNILNKCINKPYDPSSFIKPISLMPIKKHAESINTKSLHLLTTEPYIFNYKTIFESTTDISNNNAFNVMMNASSNPIKKHKKYTTEQLTNEENFIINNSLFDKTITLKVGAQVMCIANIDMDLGICNGSTGIITHFDNNIPIVKFHNGIIKKVNYHNWNSDNIEGFSISQIPLILAWAVTIHKSQGATLDIAEIDIGNSVFASGQTYVALSRLKSLDGLYLKSFNPNKIKTNKKVIQFYDRFYEEVNTDEEC